MTIKQRNELHKYNSHEIKYSHQSVDATNGDKAVFLLLGIVTAVAFVLIIAMILL